jgi:hypothetical protein
MTKILVPRPAKGSFNKDRKASDLLMAQVKHLQEAEKRLPHHLRTSTRGEGIASEGEAADYIRKVTSMLHVHGKIKVPRPAPGSFHKHRPISDLLKNQIRHFREAEMKLPAQKRTGVDVEAIKTEHEAAEYIRRVTAALHSTGAKKGATA